MRSRPLRAAATLLLLPLGTAAAVVGIAGAASAAPTVPPGQGSGHNVIVFPQRDFVSATGYGAGSSVTVQVVRGGAGGTVVSTSEPVTPVDDPRTPGFDGLVEVNHPGGGCWLDVTPDIKPGDTVLLREVNADTGLDFTDGTVTANVVVTSPATQTAPGTVEVHGTAADAAGNPIDITTLDQRLVANRDAFDANGKRTLRAASIQDDGLLEYDAPGSTHWTATYAGLDAADIARATGAEARILWLGAVPANAVESTIYEYGAIGGPAGPGCTAPLNAPVATVTPAEALFSATEVTATSAAKALTIANTGAGANADLTVSSVTSDSPDFVVDGVPCAAAIATDTSCTTQTVSFKPTTSGLKTGTITVASDGVNGPQKITVTGLALDTGAQVVKIIAQPATTKFATRLPGTTSPAERVTFTNIGNATASPDAVAVNDPAAPDTNYAVSAQTCIGTSLGADASCTVDVTFSPSAVGPRPADLVVREGATTLASAALTGEGLDVVAVHDPPATPKVSILVFTLRDFVSSSGFFATDTVSVEVIRHGVVVGFVGDQIPQDDPLTDGFDGIVEINHPGGGCWGNPYTPDIRPGDIVRTIISNPSDPTRDGQADQTHVVDVGTINAGEQSGSDLVIHGWARGMDGKAIPVGQLSQRFVANKQAFLVNGRRTLRAEAGGEGVITYDPINAVTNPDGTNWTATYKGLAQPDIDRALSTSEARIIWLGRDPIALFEGSFFEFGLTGGPAPAFCTTPAAPPTPDYEYAPNALTFPTRGVDTGASPAKTVTLRNTGNADLNLASFSLQGTDSGEFTLDTVKTTCAAGAVMAPGASCKFVVSFSPTSATPAGPRSAKIVVTDDVVGPPQNIDLNAVASDVGVPYATADVSALDFGNQPLGATTAFQRVTVTNEGQADLVLAGDSVTFAGTNGVAATHDFGLAPTATPNTCNTTVPAGGSCTVDIVFTGSALNERTSSVTIAAKPADLTVALSGRVTQVGLINDPPAGGHSILVFPERDFVSAAGYAPTDNATVEVVRNGKVIGSVVNVVPQDDPKTAGFDGLVDVNHPGGACWANNLVPDIKPGDIVRIFPNGITPGDDPKNPVNSPGDQTHTQGVTVTQAATQTAPGTVIVRGTATDVFTGGRIPLSQLEVRIISKNLFEANGKRTLRAAVAGDGTVAYDTPTGKTFTATFEGLSAADVQRTIENIDATGKNIGGETRSIWLGRDPLALTELTFFEHGVVGGAAAPCTGALTTASLTSTPASAVFTPAAFAGFAPQTILLTIANVGTLDANLEAPVITGGNAVAGEFQVVADTPNKCPVAPKVLEFGGPPAPTCSLEVLFTPSRAGIRTANLQLVSDATGSPLVVPLTGVAAVQPHLNAVAPGTGSAGTPITLTGTGFAGVDSVTVGGVALAPAKFTVVSDSVITTAVPVGADGTGITVSNVVGASNTIPFSVALPPTVGTISPTSGSSALKLPNGSPANLPVTIQGTDLGGDDNGASTRVLFNGVAGGSVTVAADGKSVTATVPTGATSGPITVVTSLGQATTLGSFTVLTQPTATSITGATTKPGSTATVNGTGFTAAANATVGLSTVQLRRTGVVTDLVGANPARTATTIRFTVPANAADVYNLFVRTPVTLGGNSYYLESPLPQLFTAAATPTLSKACVFLTSAAASAGSCPNGTTVVAGTGTWVRVEGSGFSGLSSVQFGGQKATVFSLPGDDPTLTGKVIIAQVPAGSKSGTIQVLSAGGSGSANGFTFVAVPTITTVSPTSARREGGLQAATTVTLTGTGYTATALVPVSVTLSGPNNAVVPATLVSVSATQIRFTVPVGADLGNNTITVKTIGGSASSPQRVSVTL